MYLLNWTYLDDADGFLQFWVLIRYLELISVSNQSKDSSILIKFDTLSSWIEIVSVRWSYWCIYLIGHILMMQMDSFNFGF